MTWDRRVRPRAPGTPRHGIHELSGKEKKWAEKNGLFPGLLGDD